MTFFWYVITLVSVGSLFIGIEQAHINHRKAHPVHVPKHYDDGSLDMLPYARIAARVKLQERVNRYEAIDRGIRTQA